MPRIAGFHSIRILGFDCDALERVSSAAFAQGLTVLAGILIPACGCHEITGHTERLLEGTHFIQHGKRQVNLVCSIGKYLGLILEPQLKCTNLL